MRRAPSAGGGYGHHAWPLWPWLAATTAAFLLLIFWQRVFHLVPIDDAHIFLRYAGNCALGLGPVFNPGERVEGFSSPLWLAILVLGPLAAPGSTSFSLVAGALCASLTIATVVTEALKSRVSPALAWGSGAFLATSPGVVYWASSGMDTALFSFLACAALLRLCGDLARGRVTPVTATLLSGVCLARMEGLLLVAVAISFCWVRQRSVQWRWLILPIIACVVTIIARRLYYGDWLPNTYYAKVAGARSLVLDNGLRYCWHLVGTYGPLMIATTACLSLSFKTTVFRNYLPCIAFVPIWFAYVIWTGGDHFAMGRLMQPVMPILLYGGLLGLAGIRSSARRIKPVALGALILALLTTGILEWTREGALARSEMIAATNWHELGKWLRHRVPAEGWIAAVPIGGIGSGSGHPILDLTGLTDPVIAKSGSVDPHGRPAHLKFHSEYVLRRAPAVIFLNFGAPQVGRFPVYPGYNMALSDLLKRDRTMSLYRLEVHEVAPRRFAHFLVRRDLPSLSGS